MFMFINIIAGLIKSAVVKSGGEGVVTSCSKRWGAFGSFMIIRSTLSCGHWFDCIECCHDVIYNWVNNAASYLYYCLQGFKIFYILFEQIMPKTSAWNVHHIVSISILHIKLYFYCTVSSTGHLTYSEVKMFLEKCPKTILKYQSVITHSNDTLSLSQNHLVYARKYNSDQFIPM